MYQDYDPNWWIVEEHFPPKDNPLAETQFSIGNGSIGLRGAFEEEYPDSILPSIKGTFLNGFFDTVPIDYAENAYGFARNHQLMVNLPDGRGFHFSIDGEPFHLFQGKILRYFRGFDLKQGIVFRDVIWQSPLGKRVHYQSLRFASFERKELMVFHFEITPLDGSGTILCTSTLNGDVQNLIAKDDPRVGSHFHNPPLSFLDAFHENYLGVLIQKTQNTGFALVSVMDHCFSQDRDINHRVHQSEQMLQSDFEIDRSKGSKLTLTKFVCYCSSKDTEERTVLDRAKQVIHSAKETGIQELMREQKKYFQNYWSRSDIEIVGDPHIQQALRFNQLHLIQSTGRDGKTNIPSKGLTGEGYGGHYFWDTEIYVLPYFLYTHPWIARNLLLYRISILDQAKIRAREMGHSRGALFPWRTIGGEESSAYFPAGTAQYHINADIAYALKLYMEATDDDRLLIEDGGAIMLFETARIWISLGHFSMQKDGQFCIDCVTGPDEYTALVNNNTYTNLMAQTHLLYAHEVFQQLKNRFSDPLNRMMQRIQLSETEAEEWKEAADKMYIPFNQELEIYPQDDHFLEKKRWDFDRVPKSHYPLLLHYHPLVIYRHQVCKQPDVVLAQFLLGNRFSREQKRRDFEYYEAITTHDSSLSSCIHSIMASETGHREKAEFYFQQTVRIDLDNIQHNTRDGIHAAAMAGSWMTVIFGYAGMRTNGGHLSFNPYLPSNWNQYRFKIFFRQRRINVHVDKKKALYSLESGDSITISHQNESINLKPKGAISREL